MSATPNSKVDKARSEIKKTTLVNRAALIIGMEHRSNKRCPAIIFAASRMAKVKGRIIDLTSSIKTITGTRTSGVPNGTRCAKKDDLFFKKKLNMYPTHILRLMQLVNTKCLVPVNTKGRRPNKLFTNTKIKRLTTNKFNEAGTNCPKVTLTSWFSARQTSLIVLKRELGTTQKLVESSSTLAIDNQFKESPLKPESGSKIENKLSVIF